MDHVGASCSLLSRNDVPAYPMYFLNDAALYS